MTLDPRPRRRVLGLGLAASLAWPAVWTGARAAEPVARRLTPAQTEGPFYPVQEPADHDFDLMQTGPRRYGQGQPVQLDGAVTDLDGRPLRGAQVEIWQCDARGRYHHPGDGAEADADFQGFGRVAVDGEGRFRFRAMRPAPYTGRTPHIHVKVKLGGRELLTTQLYVEGDPGNARDGLWRSLRSDADRGALTRPFTPAGDGLRASFPIVVRA